MSCALQQVHPQLVVFGGSSRALQCSFFSNVTMYTSQSSYKYTAVHITLSSTSLCMPQTTFLSLYSTLLLHLTSSYFFFKVIQRTFIEVYEVTIIQWTVNKTGKYLATVQFLLSPLEIIVHRIVYSSHFQWPGNSQGMLSQEWAAYNKANLLNQN